MHGGRVPCATTNIHGLQTPVLTLPCALLLAGPYEPPFTTELWVDVRSPITRNLVRKVRPQAHGAVKQKPVLTAAHPAVDANGFHVKKTPGMACMLHDGAGRCCASCPRPAPYMVLCAMCAHASCVSCLWLVALC